MLAELLDLLWPRKCAVCGRPSDRPRRYLCSDCVNRIPFLPMDGCCRHCGAAAEELSGEFLCDDCRRRPPAFDRAGCAVWFGQDARSLINAFKFQSHYWLRNDLVDWLEASVRARFKLDEIDLVLPMPSSVWRRFNRGFSQCDYLGRELAKRLGKPYRTRVLVRRGNPRHQSGLDAERRRENVVGTFAVRRPGLVAGRTVLLVDDIMTTGSTLSESAAVLKTAGARRVWCATVARALRR